MRGWLTRSFRRRSHLALVSLSAFLLLLPLTLSKPGLPPVLKADEAAYYLGALSLWHDGDFVCEDLDVRRLFREFSGSSNLLLMRAGAGEPVYFSVPFVYPLVATPFVGLFGANGLVLLNSALLVVMIWLGVAYLRRYNSESLSLLFTIGYFLLSTAFVYVFWLQAEIFNMACAMVAYFLVDRELERSPESSSGSNRRGPIRLLGRAAASAALLATVAYSKPMYVLLSVPLLFLLIKARAWRSVLAFAAAGVVTAAVLSGVSWSLTEQVWPYFAPRSGVTVSSPIDYVERRVDSRLPTEPASNAVGQIARSGEVMRVTIWATILEAAPEFLFGRHGGFFVYLPFAALAIVLFLLNERRSLYGWLLLASAVVIAILFATIIRGQWLGGGGFVGNRYFTTVYPTFFFLVRRIRPAWSTIIGYAAAAVFLGPLLLTPLGALVTEPTLQAHVRNQPFPALPLEWSLVDSLSGYEHVAQRGLTFYGRTDEIESHGDEVWIHGAKKVEINLLSRRRYDSLAFDVRSAAPNNRVRVCLESDCREPTFDDSGSGGTRQRLVFSSPAARPIPRKGKYGARYRYRMTIATDWGEQPRWRGSGPGRFYLGAAITFLGSAQDLERDLYSVEWLSVSPPASAPAGGAVEIPIEIRNASTESWPGTGPSRVMISYHWLGDSGEVVVRGGKRTELSEDLAAGDRFATTVTVGVPETVGPHVLVLDLVRERVGWFSERRPGQEHRLDLEIVAPSIRPEPPEDRSGR